MAENKDVPQTWTAIRVVMMPKDANPYPCVLPGFTQNLFLGTIFGGVILSHIDAAGSMAARREVILRGGNPAVALVTVAVNRVEFKHPVLVGDVVSFDCTLVKIGRTSVTMNIHVVADRGAETISVTDAEVVYVAVDSMAAERKPIPVLPAP